MKLKLFLFSLLLVICFTQNVWAKQILPESIERNTITITAAKTGETGKNYFYCSNGLKCSTEMIVREHYKNNSYKIMRGEYSFWKGMFILAFLDELYPHALEHNPDVVFYDKEYYANLDKNVSKKYQQIKKSNLQKFINSQIKKHEMGAYMRDLDEWEIEGYKNPTEYFKSPIVQEFLTRVDNKTFSKILCRILENKKNNMVGTPDYIVWNEKELVFIEVKRQNEKLSNEQIQWGKFLVKNKIPYKVARVVGK